MARGGIIAVGRGLDLAKRAQTQSPSGAGALALRPVIGPAGAASMAAPVPAQHRSGGHQVLPDWLLSRKIAIRPRWVPLEPPPFPDDRPSSAACVFAPKCRARCYRRSALGRHPRAPKPSRPNRPYSAQPRWLRSTPAHESHERFACSDTPSDNRRISWYFARSDSPSSRQERPGRCWLPGAAS